MKRKIVLLLVCALSVFSINAQNQYTISGYLNDSESGEALIGAHILVTGSFTGTTTNNYGFYSITMPSGKVGILFSYAGYERQALEFDLKKDTVLNISMKPSVMLSEFVLVDSVNQEVASSQMSVIKVPIKTIKAMPALLGEVDVLKSIQMLPGVQSGSEGTSGLYVRGGGPDQNLILLDGVPVYNANHLFGFFSVFNADALNNVELIKGGFPARYGGRLSSVLDISMKEGNMKKHHAEGSIGAIASKLTVEGPIIKDKTSFIISGRRTYLDVLAQPLIQAIEGSGQQMNTGYYFYDINAKVNHIFSSKDRLFLSVYNGKDEFYNEIEPYQYLYEGVIFQQQSRSNLNWGNLTSAMRWTHQFNNKLFMKTNLSYSNYEFMVDDYMENIETNDTATLSNIFSINYLSGIRDLAGRVDFDYLPGSKHFVRFGGGYTYHTFKPGATAYHQTSMSVTQVDSTVGSSLINAGEIFLYAEDDYKITDRLKVNMGLHYSAFALKEKYYHSLQPRFSMRYLVNSGFSIKASYARMQQYVHLLTNNNISLPTDLWVPSNEVIPPQMADQIAAGVSTSLPYNLKLSVEGYYKWMNNVIEYRDGATFLNSSTEWFDKLEVGKGRSYGLEVFFQKEFGKLKGWIGYTWSHSKRQFDNINFGEEFPYKYDRRHDVSVVMSFPVDDLWDMSITWVYGTGNALTLPTTRYQGSSLFSSDYDAWSYWDIWRGEIQAFDEKNSFRMAAYHRLDVGFTRTKQKKWGEVIWNIGLYNAYNRKNPFYYYFGTDNMGNRALKRVSIFPLIPSVSLSFKI